MYEAEIKKIVIEHLSEKKVISYNDILVEEFRYMRGKRRTDIAIFTKNMKLVSIEIKTQFDDISKLIKQLECDSRSFHKVYCFCHEKFKSYIDKMELKENIEVYLYNKLHFKRIRRGRAVSPMNHDLIKLLNDTEINVLLSSEVSSDLSYQEKIKKLRKSEIIDKIYQRFTKIKSKRKQIYISVQSSS